jgi:type I restriction enzyme S subunit
MPEGKIQEILTKLRQGLELLYGERLVGLYLFGSFARAEATPESDVDVLIVLDEVTDYGREIERTGHLVSGLSLDYDVSISRVFVSSAAWRHRDSPFLANVRRQAQAA